MAAEISWYSLLWCLLPIGLSLWVYILWKGQWQDIVVASVRMVLQLVAIGYVLLFLFDYPSPWISLLVVSIMMFAAAWISIRPVRHHPGFFVPSLIALVISVALHLIISLFFVLSLENWYEPRVVIPLAGMYFANTMNAISLAVERFHAELHEGKEKTVARLIAFRAAMIPQVNSLLAVGLVSLPGMMTGQILSGISPLIAVRYQIMIMAMILGTCAVGSAIVLSLLCRKVENSQIDIQALNK